jgi:THO complex subunit 5
MEDTIEALRSIADDVVALRQENADVDKLQNAIKQGCLLLCKLREQHRVASLESERLKEDTSAKKALFDESNLQLENLLYEKQYFEREIAGNQAFKSAIPDEDIVLAPVEEFKAACVKLAKTVPENEHDLMLGRLTYEETQRKELTRQLHALEEVKQQKASGVAARKAQLDDLHNQLRVLGQAAKPLQDALVPSLNQRMQNRTADLLPAPLYIIYSQYTSGRDMLGLSVDVKISGSLEDVQRLASHGDASSSGGDKVVPASSSKRRRKEAAVTTADDDLYKVCSCACRFMMVLLSVTHCRCLAAQAQIPTP